ncbi:hypothetical protein, partial [Mesorhizobium sp.]|uniref:hypothetical protein n=1 Tax=Mesorhizobium sp. TaxID=1871066 RepID=UPI0025DE2382
QRLVAVDPVALPRLIAYSLSSVILKPGRAISAARSASRHPSAAARPNDLCKLSLIKQRLRKSLTMKFIGFLGTL